MGDPEHKRKRYCLMCNVFKPDRCHHCSACNRCVLNMDHHCPWVNNCIGFWNRKYFLLLLFYGVTSLVFFIVTMLPSIIDTIYWYVALYKDPSMLTVEELIVNISLDVTFIIIVFLIFVLTRFTSFHITLVRRNITTLESLEHKGVDYDNQVILLSF